MEDAGEVLHKPKAILVGACHDLQLSSEAKGSLKALQESYREIITDSIMGQTVRLVAEEARFERFGRGWKVNSFAFDMAGKSGTDYCSLDISPPVKRRVHHVPAYDQERGINNLACNNYAKAWNLVREWHMLEKCRMAIRGLPLLQPAPSCVIIVGLRHLEAFSTGLSNEILIVKSVEISPGEICD